MAEKEYIERETLINACKKIIHDRWNETTAPVSWSHAYADFIDDINEQPTADVVEVVRCKDCKHLWRGFPERGMLSCMQNPFRRRQVMLDDFCSYGERKELDNEQN